jgi:hypothetical protein
MMKSKILIIILMILFASSFTGSFTPKTKAASQIFYESFKSLDSMIANKGVLTGSNYSFVPGVKGNGVNFTSTRVSYPLPNNMEQGTVEFWFKPNSDFFNQNCGFFDVGFLSGLHPASMGIFWNITEKKIMSEIRDDLATHFQSWSSNQINPPDNKWHRVDFVWKTNTGSGDFFQVYLDGVAGTYQGMTGRTFHPSLQADYKMTAGFTGWYGYTHSVIDELKVFDYQKTADEISIDEFSPVINSFTPEAKNQIIDPGTAIDFALTASSPVGNPLTTKWYLNGSEVATGSNYSGYLSDEQRVDVVKAVVTDNVFSASQDWGLLVRGADINKVMVFDDSYFIGNQKFLIKGIDYTPWLIGTGPDPSKGQLPLPDENADVTDKVTYESKTYVPDYSGDGKIQMKEVIQYDLETMKGAGANTIRTYASGWWHDKNMNNVIDRNTNYNLDEIVQGDLPDWLLDQMLNFAQANKMKVIIGYWVQEENFIVDEPDNTLKPYHCNWDDFEIAKKTLGRVIQKYSSHPALLSWGIGNEVNGSFNSSWFTWTVNVNEYLNRLYDYARSIDPGHKPITYAKYIGEAANFDTLSAEVIGPQAYTFPADEIASEFSLPAPAGRAYLLAEFGHYTHHIDGHWTLASKHAGGCFLEYTDVGWKGSGQNNMGMVYQYRAKKNDRLFAVEQAFMSTQVLEPGWNMISLPIDPVSSDPAEVFKDPFGNPINISDNLFRYDHNLLGYVSYFDLNPSDFGPLERGDGYWINVQQITVLKYSGTLYTEPLEIAMSGKGWYLAGTSIQELDLVQLQLRNNKAGETVSFDQAVANGWVSNTLFGWKPSELRYWSISLDGPPLDDSSSLVPWQGYWINTNIDNLTLIIPYR